MSSQFLKSQNPLRLSQSHLLPGIEEFRRILTKVGIVLSSSEQPHIINQEQALVVRELSKLLDDTEASVKFVSGLKYICKKDKHLKKCLVPTQFQKGLDYDKIVYQDSLLSMFLRVPQLQDDVIDLLLDHITNISIEQTQDTSWLRMLLKPLRCLPIIKRGDKMAKKLLDILEIATFPCQLEILEAIPEIIPDNQCDFTAKQLSKLLDEDDQLCGAIVDCLTALNLEAEIRTQICDLILARINSGVSLKVYLLLIKFLLGDLRTPTVVSTLLKIRNSLDNMMGVGNKEKESDKTLIFCYLQSAALTQKQVAEGWLNTISNIKSHSEHRPVDLLIIFMLHHTSEIRKKVVEAIFRKRVSLGLFKTNLINKTFEQYITQQLLKDYMVDIIDLGCYLLRHAKDANVARFASTLFQKLFNHNFTPAVYRGEIIQNLISLTGSNDQYTINTVLKLIMSLVAEDYQKVQTHIALLAQLMEKLDTLEFRDVKLTFDILCSLVCGDRATESLTGFRDQIFNTIRKQLSCSERSVKHRGIISAIVMVKHTASVDGDQTDISSIVHSETSALNLSAGPAKEAAEILDLVNCGTGDNPDLLYLYYDQLASVLASEQAFDKYFLFWLYKKVEDDFEAIFLTENVPESVNDLDFSMQYVLNKPEDTDSTFSINIAGYTVCAKNDKILLLAPYFRVLRLLHFRQHEHLNEIDSLLGCGVVLPEVSHPEDLESDQIKQVADCLFHCANWFREIVNAFVTQKDPMIQERVVNRLDNLIEVENKLFLFLKHVPGHNLPLSFFTSMNVSKQSVKVDSKTSRQPKKKFKSAAVVANDTLNNTNMNTQMSMKSVTTSKKIPTSQIGPVKFREMDTDLIRLIKYPLSLDVTGENLSSERIYLNLSQMKFILTDFTSKLTLLTQQKDVGLSNLNDVNPEHLIRDCVRIVKNLNSFLESVVKQIEDILNTPEETRYTDEVNDIKTCFGHILQIFCLIFMWSGFQLTGNIDLLKSILRAAKDSKSQSMASTNRLILDFIAKISNYSKCCLHLNHAVSLIKIIDSLQTFTVSSTEIKEKLSATAEDFLSRRWYDSFGKLDRGQLSNQNIDVIVKAYFKDVSTERIAKIVEHLLEDTQSLEPRNGCLTRFPAIDIKNFHVFFLGLCNALLTSIKTEIQSLTNTEHITLWFTVAVVLNNMKTISKTVKNRNNMSCFLKKTIGILKVFLSHGIPILEIMMKTRTSEVYNVLKTIQTTTRFLHHLCCQSKASRDGSIVAHIPSFKLTIESIIYRVKAALVANNCSSAFWLGNLKNRDIDGMDILSQSSVQSSVSSSHDVDNEQLPSDEEDENFINNEVEEEEVDESVESEVYDD